MSVIIRSASPADAGALLEIYRYYVECTAITFEWDVPSVDEFRQRINSVLKKYPYLVLEEEKKIIGYAYAGVFKDRAAYDWSCELTIYIDHQKLGNGYGRKLYTELERVLSAMGITNLYACIAYPENNDEYLSCNSVDFHSHLGFSTAGKFLNCGYKFGRWYHMVWMEKIINKHCSVQPNLTNWTEHFEVIRW